MLDRHLAATANAVRQPLIAAEAGIEDAISSVARLTLALLEARAAQRVSVVESQYAFDHNAELMAMLTSARRRTGEMHRALAQEIAKRAPSAYGDQFECPEVFTPMIGLASVPDVRAA